MRRFGVWQWCASAALIAVGIGASPAAAQTAGAVRVRAGVSAGLQTDSAGLSQSFSVNKNLEAAPIAAELSPLRVPELDGGVSVTLVEGLGVGLSISYVGKTAPAQISARIPHVFFFNQPRAISGEATVEHKEITTHLSGVYIVTAGAIDVAIAAGLSFFSVDKDFVADVTYSESYPFDTAAFGEAVLRREHVSENGYHAGADVTWNIARRWGLGGLVRYSRAKARFSADTLDVGGLQAGAGLRVRF